MMQNQCVNTERSHYSGTMNGTINIVVGGGGFRLSGFGPVQINQLEYSQRFWLRLCQTDCIRPLIPSLRVQKEQWWKVNDSGLHHFKGLQGCVGLCTRWQWTNHFGSLTPCNIIYPVCFTCETTWSLVINAVMMLLLQKKNTSNTISFTTIFDLI
jgi:hypothetical protein